MNDAESTQDRWLTTEQIAAAGNAPDQQEEPAPAGHQGYEDDNARQGYEDDNAVPLAADQAASGTADRSAPYAGNGAPAAAAAEPRASLLEDGELQSITARWKDIQAEFVDEPTTALREADALVAELMQRLATTFAAERGELEDRWAGGTQVSTEDLRQGLRRYRSFFERLLVA
jgi:hypothetical protein